MKRKDLSIKQELDNLQLNSWNLELLISGFTIFLVISSRSAVDDLSNFSDHLIRGTPDSSIGLILFIAILLRGIWYCTLFNLLIHLFLRGFWVSLIGLRYVSNKIQLFRLNYAEEYKRELEKMTPYDDYIEKVEKICSVIFALTFLILFFSLSFFCYLLFIMFTSAVLTAIAGPESSLLGWVPWVLTLPWFIYFLDFITIGGIKRIKKNRLIRRIYLPNYRVLSVLSLAILYRPLYYNLIDNKYGRRIKLFLLLYVVFLFS